MGEPQIDSNVPLVVLAAGLGTRFGGSKVLAPVGIGGEPLLAIALEQAAAAGFTHVVLVARPDLHDAVVGLAAVAQARVGLRVDVVDQATSEPSRDAPWGTVAAILIGVGAVGPSDTQRRPVVVANGDDLYGVEGLRRARDEARTLAAGDRPADAVCVAYPFGASLLPAIDPTASGEGVSRGLCRVDDEGRLLELHEGRHLLPGDVAADAPVSMNLWALGPRVLAQLQDRFAAFVEAHQDDPNGELGLPDALGALLAEGRLVARVVPTGARWLGVTFAEDVERVRAALLEPIAAAFGRPAPTRARLIGTGHIHATVVADGVVYQRINTDVFGDLETLADTTARVSEHLRARRTANVAVPAPVRTTTGDLLWRAPDGAVWRATEEVPDVEATPVARSAAEAEEAARAFGAFVAALADLPGPALRDAIPRFHDFAWRRAQLAAAVAADRLGRRHACRSVVADAEVLAAEVADALSAVGADGLPPRVVHNDAKIANVLFRDGRAVAVVDLDTVMVGTLLADLGELLRTGATSAAEDEPDVASVELDHERIAAIVTGFLDGLGGLATPAELTALPYSGAWLATENGLRFLADHLDGDRYFGADRPEHNLDRARAQLRLGALLLDAAPHIARLVHRRAPTTGGPP